MTVHIGFTGTQAGMTEAQQTRAYRLLLAFRATDLHHGDCIGADDQMDQIGRELGLTIYIHPPDNPSKRAWCNTRPIGESWTEHPPQSYLLRNKAIVESARTLIAAPKETAETVRSGTWSTVRYARKVGKPVYIVWPDGSVTEERTP